MATIKLAYINSTGGYVQPTSTSDAATDLGKISLTGVSGVALDAGGASVTNLPLVPTNGSDAASKSYVDSVAGGLFWLNPAQVVATSAITLSGSQTIDGVTPGNGARVLVTGQGGAGVADVNNGIYIVNTGGAWTRSADTLQAGSALFVTEGTTYHDTQWVLVTNNPITVGVTAIVFNQFGASTSYSAGDGINIVGNTISVKGDGTQGVNVDATDGVQVKLNTAKALSFDGTGKLQVKADTAAALTINATTGLQVLADNAKAMVIDSTYGLQVLADTTKSLTISGTYGLQVKADGNYGLSQDSTSGLRLKVDGNGGLDISTGYLAVKVADSNQLSTSGSGLSVVGVPSGFKIGSGTTNSTNVTSTNLNTLTDGTSVTALHYHAATQFSLYAYDSFTLGQVGYWDTGFNGMRLARADSVSTSNVVGMAGAAGGGGGLLRFQNSGFIVSGLGLTNGTVYYLSDVTAGALVPYSSLSSGSRAIRIGIAAGDLVLNIQDMGVKP